MKNVFKCGAISIALAFSILFIFACGTPRNTNSNTVNTNSGPSPSATADETASGRELYKQNCAACHRDNGTGGKVTIDGKELDPKDLTSEKMKSRSDKRLTEDITEGAPDDGMPAFKEKLTESQIKETVHFLRAALQKMPSKTSD